MTAKTFLFHDYETTGLSTRLDRPAQFAAVRTDEDFNVVEEPVMIYCKPALDTLTSPYAALITGITPQHCEAEGMSEFEFSAKVYEEFMRPNTCGTGYNNVSFDDEITRNLFYRNFKPIYDREFSESNSRFDVINAVRLFSTLRPEGIAWPLREDGIKSLKLEHLAKANNLLQEKAHDALSDVYATVALAKLLKSKDPEFFEYCLSLRDKSVASEIVSLSKPIPFIHAGSHYKGGFGVLYPVISDPTNKNATLCAVVSEDVSDIENASAEDLASRLYTKKIELEEVGERRPALQSIALNKLPAVAPFRLLSLEDRERLGINDESVALMKARCLLFKHDADLRNKVQDVYAISKNNYPKFDDPDEQIYGSFPSFPDKKLIKHVGNSDIETMPLDLYQFNDQKYDTLLFRCKARNFFERMNASQQEKWDLYCYEKLFFNKDKNGLTVLEKVTADIKAIEEGEDHKNKAVVVPALRKWIHKIEERLGYSPQLSDKLIVAERPSKTVKSPKP